MNAPAKILIVDDEEVVRLSFTRVLAAAHCDVQAVWSWDQVAALMQRDPFDVVLLDLRMPGTDGMAILQALKARWPDSEVVIVTGYPTLDTAKAAVALGAYDYLTKPVGPDEVVGAARSALLHKQWALHCDRSEADAMRVPVSSEVRGTVADRAESMRRSS